MLRQQISFCYANSIGWQWLAALLRQISRVTPFRPQPRKNFRRPLLVKLFRKPLEQLLAVQHSLFEAAEHRTMQQPGASSKRSPHLWSIGLGPAQPRLLLEMPQSRECSQSPHFGTPHSPSIGLGPAQPRLLLEMPQSRECSQSPHFGTPPAVAKIPARQ